MKDKSDKARLEECRIGIDTVDREVVELLSKRVSLAGEIGTIKRQSGTGYFDPAREAEVMDKISALNPGPMSGAALRAIYREIISASIALEKELCIAYLGPEATYTHQAAIRSFGTSLSYRPLKTIPDVFAEVDRGDADYGVIPIENSNEGAVFHSMDMLVESDLHIVSQLYLPIEHCLVSQSGLEGIREVHSKDQAIGQCREWLRRYLPDAQLVDTASTAAAVKTAAKRPEVAAIASFLAAELNDIPVVKRGIQDKADNVTRFLVIGKTVTKPLGEGRDKTSLVISINDEAGALEKALKPFAKRGINLSKIESRPSRRKAWDYYFFIDLIGHYEDAPVQEAISELEAHCPLVKWLGSYPNVSREGA